MYKFFQVSFLILISFIGYSQCEKNQIVFIDATGGEINPNCSYFVFKLNNQLDTIKLTHLYDDSFTRSNDGFSFNTFQEDSENVSRQEDAIFCVSCNKVDVKIVDSIDINQDGIKEIFLFRRWYCSVSPPNPEAYGVGIHGQIYSQYEVWNIESKKQIFEVKNGRDGSVAISTNVGRNYGYHFKVEIDKKGSFLLSDLSREGSKLEMGKYFFDKMTGNYKKE